jgi:hypothetical protein
MDQTVRNNPDEVSLKDLVAKLRSYRRYLWSKWLLIVIFGLLGAVIGILYSLYKKPVYTATCSFVLDENKTSGLSQYAGLASMAGIDLSGSSGGVFGGDNIIALYTSRSMITKCLLDTASFNGKPQQLIDRYADFLHLKDQWAKKELDINFTTTPEKFNRATDSVLIDIVDFINKKVLIVTKPDKKLDIINVDVSFGDELFAKNFDDKLVATVNNFYILTKTKKTAATVAVLQRQADSVRQQLNASIGGVASALDASPNANPALLSLRVPSQRKQVDVQASTAIYSELIKNLELSKISLRQETPLIQVIDSPVLPLTVKHIGKITGFVAGAFLGAVFIILCLSVIRVYALVIGE